MTLRAQGAATLSEERLRRPSSARASRYFMSPAWPASIQARKWASSSNSRTGAMPERSKPVSWAARLTRSVMADRVGMKLSSLKLTSGAETPRFLKLLGRAEAVPLPHRNSFSEDCVSPGETPLPGQASRPRTPALHSCVEVPNPVREGPRFLASDSRLATSDCLLDSQLLDFLVVVLAVEDVPLLAAFEDGALLAFDFLARGLVDAGFLQEEVFEDFAHFQADRVAIFDEVGFGRLGQRVGDDVGQLVHFVAAQSQ